MPDLDAYDSPSGELTAPDGPAAVSARPARPRIGLSSRAARRHLAQFRTPDASGSAPEDAESWAGALA